MTVQVPAERIDQEVDSRLQSMKATVRLEDFVPARCRSVSLRKIRHAGAPGGHAAGYPLDSAGSTCTGKSATRRRTKDRSGGVVPGETAGIRGPFEVFPEITAPINYGFKIIRPVVEIGAADIEAMLEKLRRQRVPGKRWIARLRPVTKWSSTLKARSGVMSSSGARVRKCRLSWVQTPWCPARSRLVGASAGEEKTLRVVFPADYPSQEVAGKDVEFRVKSIRYRKWSCRNSMTILPTPSASRTRG